MLQRSRSGYSPKLHEHSLMSRKAKRARLMNIIYRELVGEWHHYAPSAMNNANTNTCLS